LEAYKVVDCAFHRSLEYLDKGAPQLEMIGDNISKMPKYSYTSGFLGFTGYNYFLNSVAEHMGEVTAITYDDTTVKANVKQFKEDFNAISDTTKVEY
jgi:hypothetical protein